MTSTFDALIIGAGQAGPPLATGLAAAGWNTAIIEREYVGGTCVNVGCTPTKTMVASARAAHMARRGGDYGVQTGDVSVDLAVVRQRKRDIVTSFRTGGEHRLTDVPNLELIRGEARFSDAHTLSVALTDGGTRTVTAPVIVINAGGRNNTPPLAGLEHVPSYDSTALMELDTVPDHLLVLGGGYIGVEFGQMFRRFGAHVTIVQRGAQLLPLEDRDIADAVAAVLRDDGITVLTGASANRVAQANDGSIALTVKTDAGEQQLTGSHLLVATGRTPNSDLLDLPAAGIASDKRGYITVDDHLATNVAGVYATGDIKGGPAFTHISYDDSRVLLANLLHHEQRSIAGRMLPYTVFLDPQLGRIGLTEQQARAQGYNIRVARIPMTYVARALEADETRGVMKAVVDRASERILGAAVLGLEGGEIAGALQIAMMGNLPYTALRDGIFSHPTLLESLNTLFSVWVDED